MNQAVQPTTEQIIAGLERATQQLQKFQNEVLQLTPVEQQKAQPKIAEYHDLVKRLRVSALRSLKPGDAANLTRAIGVVHAYPVFLELGIGSLPALVTCTKRQFMRIARPPAMGWGQDNPPITDPDIVASVEKVLTSLNLHWREPKGKELAKLPEPVLSPQFHPNFTHKERFTEESFAGYAHPAVVRGIPNKFDSIVKELGKRGVYSWEDLAHRTAADLRRAGVPSVQIPVIQYEMRRRGVYFAKEEKPAIVYQDMFEVDKLVVASCKACETTWNPEGVTESRVIPCKKCGAPVEVMLIDSKDPLSFEDRVVVRDKHGKRVNVIDVADELKDRIDAVDEGSDQASVGEGVYVDPSEKETAVEPEPEEPAAEAPQGPQSVPFPVATPPANQDGQP